MDGDGKSRPAEDEPRKLGPKHIENWVPVLFVCFAVDVGS